MSTEVISKRSLPQDQPTNGLKKQRQGSIIAVSDNPVDATTGISKCFYKFTTKLYVSLAPCYVNSPIDGIRQQHLDSLVMSYYQPARGVVLGYYNIRLSEENKSEDSYGNPISVARISDDTPFAFLWCTVDLLVWRPQVGDVIEGWIYMQTQSHIGLLIHDTFNATIKKFNIPPTWQFIPSQMDEISNGGEGDSNNDGTGEGNTIKNFRSLGQWVDSNGVSIEGKLKFTIKALHTSGRVVSVEGALLEPGSESEFLPVVRNVNKHKKFEDAADTTASEIPFSLIDPVKDADIEVPIYKSTFNEDDEDEDNKVVGGEIGTSEEEDSD